jgi:hypothetical protein
MLMLLGQTKRVGKEARYMWDGTSVTGREGRMNFLIFELAAAQQLQHSSTSMHSLTHSLVHLLSLTRFPTQSLNYSLNFLPTHPHIQVDIQYIISPRNYIRHGCLSRIINKTMKHSPYWKGTIVQLVKKTLRFYETRSIWLFHSFQSPLVPVQSHNNPAQNCLWYLEFISISFTLKHLTSQVATHLQKFGSKFYTHTCVFCLMSAICQTPDLPWFDQLNNIWWRVKIMKQHIFAVLSTNKLTPPNV